MIFETDDQAEFHAAICAAVAAGLTFDARTDAAEGNGYKYVIEYTGGS